MYYSIAISKNFCKVSELKPLILKIFYNRTTKEHLKNDQEQIFRESALPKYGRKLFYLDKLLNTKDFVSKESVKTLFYPPYKAMPTWTSLRSFINSNVSTSESSIKDKNLLSLCGRVVEYKEITIQDASHISNSEHFCSITLANYDSYIRVLFGYKYFKLDKQLHVLDRLVSGDIVEVYGYRAHRFDTKNFPSLYLEAVYVNRLTPCLNDGPVSDILTQHYQHIDLQSKLGNSCSTFLENYWEGKFQRLYSSKLIHALALGFTRVFSLEGHYLNLSAAFSDISMCTTLFEQMLSTKHCHWLPLSLQPPFAVSDSLSHLEIKFLNPGKHFALDNLEKLHDQLLHVHRQFGIPFEDLEYTPVNICKFLYENLVKRWIVHRLKWDEPVFISRPPLILYPGVCRSLFTDQDLIADQMVLWWRGYQIAEFYAFDTSYSKHDDFKKNGVPPGVFGQVDLNSLALAILSKEKQDDKNVFLSDYSI